MYLPGGIRTEVLEVQAVRVAPEVLHPLHQPDEGEPHGVQV
jgi:hypothetical protein